MKSFIFENIKYFRPRHNRAGNNIAQVIGLDTETTPEGKPFIFCTSCGESFTLKDIPYIFFTRKYRDVHFGIYNLKFDSGSILYGLPFSNLNELRIEGQTVHNGYKYNYIPHKRLRISARGHGVTFWNIAQFYNCSLEKAASKYLNEHKDDIETKTFTAEYIKINLDKIKKYCIQDAVLTARLYDYLVNGLKDLALVPTALYSTASLSYQYFRKNSKIEDVWDLWCKHPYYLKLACWSYTGGKFEIYKRGKFTGYNYDINSAYPYEMSKLKSLVGVRLRCKPIYQETADYGFLKVWINNKEGFYLPCAIKAKGLNIYPAGSFYCTITKSEYEYIISLGIDVKIISACWLWTQTEHRPYEKIVNGLYERKTHYKDIDRRQYMLTKIMLNGFYGKCCQLIQKNNGDLMAGNCWNPIYASIITANTRVRLCEICNERPKDIIAVHTDSIILKTAFPQNLIGEKLGQWSLAGHGEGVMVACGVYQLESKTALRGFLLDKYTDLKNILKQAGDAGNIELDSLSVKSWIECVFRNKRHLTNRFIYEKKQLDLNQDLKRNWFEHTTGNKLLNESQESYPLLVFNNYKR